MNLLIGPLNILGLIVVWTMYLVNGPTFVVFSLFFFLILIAKPPKCAFSPLSVFYAYYGVSYILAPMFADRYSNVLQLKEYSLSLAFAFTVFTLGVLSIQLGEFIALRKSKSVERAPMSIGTWASDQETLKKLIAVLYVTSTLLIVAIVLSSGGIDRWWSGPGAAFLNRAGSGPYVVLSHFSSVMLALLVGYMSFVRKSLKYLLFFVVWLFLTSPVHGSKLQISLLVLLVALPWLKNLALFKAKALSMYITLVGIFLAGLIIRQPNASAMSIVKSSLNYFSVLENLAISVRDFQPDILKTFFLPFVKFQTPIGLAQANMYYDMNHFLTDKYYPQTWAIRATEQWPVETDLYLNFKFFGGLPLVALYLFICGYVYGRAVKEDSLGHWAAAFLMTVFMFSHLRGSLINHTDFYMYPFIFFVFYILRNFQFNQNAVKSEV